MAYFKNLIIPVNTKHLSHPNPVSANHTRFHCPENTVLTGLRDDSITNEMHVWISKLVSGNYVCYYDEADVRYSQPIQESGKQIKRASVFVCPPNCAIVGRMHSGDENGTTTYSYVQLKLGDFQVYTTKEHITLAIKESGGNSGYSEFNCPPNSVMTGREHLGDENGTTIYHYSELYILMNGKKVNLSTIDIVKSDMIKESSGIWAVASQNKVMMGRSHWSDENGKSEYRFAYVHYELDSFIEIRPQPWSRVISDSADEVGFMCPENSVLIGREKFKEGMFTASRYRYGLLEFHGDPLFTMVPNGAPPVISDERVEEFKNRIPNLVMTGRNQAGFIGGFSENYYNSFMIPSREQIRRSWGKVSPATPVLLPSAHPPYSSIGKLYFYVDGKKTAGTAVVIGDNIILTCAHNIFLKGITSRNITFYPGYVDGYSSTYGEFPVKSHNVQVMPGWDGEHAYHYDLAVLYCEPNEEKKTMVDVGMPGLPYNIYESYLNYDFECIGYSSNHEERRVMYKQKGMYAGHSAHGMLTMYGDMGKGASGGPWIRIDESGRFNIVGIQSTIDTASGLMSAAKIGREALLFIASAVQKFAGVPITPAP